MGKKIIILSMIMGLMGIGLVLNDPRIKLEFIFYNVIFILIICSLEIIKNLFKINFNIVTIVQMIIICLLMFFGYIGVILIYLYLYQLKVHEESIAQLKELNKGDRDGRHKIEKKLLSFDKYLEQSKVLASLKERNFIAQKLHDKLGHRITGSLMQLEVTKEIMDKDIETSKKYLINAMENLRQGMDEIRLVLRNVKPKDKVIGIEDIKKGLLKFEYISGMKTELIIEGNIGKLELNTLIIIEDNIQEALTNAAKYSKANKVKVSIFVYNKIARIEVRDNGIGCISIEKGMGLRGIEERMRSINGRLKYYNDNGFVINMQLNCGGYGVYILKNNSPEQIVNAIASVYNDTIVMNEVILGKLHNKGSEPKFIKYQFTDREKDIIIAISEGLSNKDISKKLFISEGTIRNYITTILDKTGLDHRTGIAVNYLKGNL